MTRPHPPTNTLTLAAWATTYYVRHAPLLFTSPWCRLPNSDTRRVRIYCLEQLAQLRLEAEQLGLPWRLHYQIGRALYLIDEAD